MAKETNFHNIPKDAVQINKEAVCTLKARRTTGELIDVEVKGVITDTSLLHKEDILSFRITEQLTQNDIIQFPPNQITTIWFDDVTKLI